MVNKISKNFALKEVIYTSTGLDNEPSFEHWLNLSSVIHRIMQPVRDNFKVPIKITSGYRSYSVNKKVGGVYNSQHLSGEAIDFICEKVELEVIFNWINDNLIFDQLILEPSWIHVSLKRCDTNRMQSFIKQGK